MTSLSIAFIASKCLPFDSTSLDQGPLGGTETGVIRLAQALSDRGHDVTVYTSHPAPKSSRPMYRTMESIHTSPMVDVLIAVRDWFPLCVALPSRARCYWTGDSFDQPQTFGIGDKRVIARIDALFAVSAWHAATLSAQSGFPIERTWVLRNGIHAPYFTGTETRKRKRLIYSSTPYRGLALCPALLTALLEKHPDAELHVYSGYDVYGGGEGHELREFETLKRKLQSTPQCHFHGNIPQQQLAREFMRSSILFYPNIFAETSCITALEAQAAGCAIVTSDLGALKETVGEAGFVIPGKPGTADYNSEFVAAADRLLSDDQLFARISTYGQTRAAAEFSWEHRAAELELLLNNGLSAPQSK